MIETTTLARITGIDHNLMVLKYVELFHLGELEIDTLSRSFLPNSDLILYKITIKDSYLLASVLDPKSVYKVVTYWDSVKVKEHNTASLKAMRALSDHTVQVAKLVERFVLPYSDSLEEIKKHLDTV